MIDEQALWRRCEVAWGQWLGAQGHAVTRLTDATSNTPHSGAPLVDVAGRLLRAPDLLATQSGRSQYWEVKTRSRSEVDVLTGVRSHWMERAAFRDYLTLSESAQMQVWVVLYEAPTAMVAGRWLRADVRHLAEAGSAASRRGAGGRLVAAWEWPVSQMEVVEGPVLNVATQQVPLLPTEGAEVGPGLGDLAPIERSLRKKAPRPEQQVGGQADLQPAASGGGPGQPVTSLPHWLDAEPAVALDVLRRSLGVPHLPRYSVLRIGDVADVDELLGLLEYGIRVFLVTSTPAEPGEQRPALAAFRDSRMLEWAVVPEASWCDLWVVDGAWQPGVEAEAAQAMQAADDSGGVNRAQYEVVHAPVDADVMVTAGAGTGKTETMSERIVFLLATSGAHERSAGSSPTDLRADEVALVTFTREAAAQMRERIARTLLLRRRLCRRCALPVLAWMMQLSGADIVTIHTLAKRLAASSAAVLGLGPEFRVARRTLEVQEAAYRALSDPLSALIQQHPGQVPPAYEWVRHVQAVWDALENNGVDLLRLGSDDGQVPDVDWGVSFSAGLEGSVVQVTHQVVVELAKVVREMCLRDQTLPTNQLVLAATAALASRHDSPVRRYRYVFVDEFQDTDAAQMDMLLHLRQRLGCRILVVGDAKQGVYRFRGAEGNAFEEMQRRVQERGLPEMRQYPLTRNFRSGGSLLDSLHPHFTRWGELDLLPYGIQDRLREQVGQVDTSAQVQVEEVGKDEEATKAALKVSQWKGLFRNGSIGVLCRQNWQAAQVQQAVRKVGLPCELRVGGSFYTSPAVRELRALLEAVANPSDAAALLELCETRWAAGIMGGQAPFGVPSEEWGQTRAAPVQWQVRLAAAASTGRFLRDDLVPLRQRVESLRQMLRTTPVLAWVVECAGTFQPEGCALPALDDDTERLRYERCLSHLVTLMDAQFQDRPTTLERLLSWLRLQVATNHTEDEPEGDTADKVVALTVHKSKGLEFDCVLVPFTATRFGPPASVATRTSVLRKPGSSPHLLWDWRPSRGRFSNVAGDRRADWDVDEADTAKEETRLLYVAMTRARERLVLLTCSSTRRDQTSPQSWGELLRAGG